MVMPARVADARVADVLCGEGAAGMHRWAHAPKQIQSRFETLWSVLFTPG